MWPYVAKLMKELLPRYLLLLSWKPTSTLSQVSSKYDLEMNPGQQHVEFTDGILSRYCFHTPRCLYILRKVDANRVLPLVWTRIEHKTLGTNPCNTDNWFHSTSARAMPDLGMKMNSVPQEHHLYSQIWYDNRRCNIQELLTTEASWFPGPVRHPTGPCRVFGVLPPVQEGSVEAGAERLLA